MSVPLLIVESYEVRSGRYMARTYVRLLNAVVMEMSSNYDEKKNDEAIAMNRRDRNIQDLTKSSGPDESEGHQRLHPLP